MLKSLHTTEDKKQDILNSGKRHDSLFASTSTRELAQNSDISQSFTTTTKIHSS